MAYNSVSRLVCAQTAFFLSVWAHKKEKKSGLGMKLSQTWSALMKYGIPDVITEFYDSCVMECLQLEVVSQYLWPKSFSVKIVYAKDVTLPYSACT